MIKIKWQWEHAEFVVFPVAFIYMDSFVCRKWSERLNVSNKASDTASSLTFSLPAQWYKSWFASCHLLI